MKESVFHSLCAHKRRLTLASTFATTLTTALGLTMASPSQAGEYNFVPGLWETTSTTEISGVPPEMAEMMNKGPQTEQECVTEADLVFAEEQGCTYSNERVSDSLLKMSMSCNDGITGGKAAGLGEIHFKGKTSDGWFEVKMKGPIGGTMTMKSQFTAKYISECK